MGTRTRLLEGTKTKKLETGASRQRCNHFIWRRQQKFNQLKAGKAAPIQISYFH